MRIICSILLVAFYSAAQAGEASPRKTTSLNGEWTFHRDGSKETKTVMLPTHWETHEGLKFDGIGWYEKIAKYERDVLASRDSARIEPVPVATVA